MQKEEGGLFREGGGGGGGTRTGRVSCGEGGGYVFLSSEAQLPMKLHTSENTRIREIAPRVSMK